MKNFIYLFFILILTSCGGSSSSSSLPKDVEYNIDGVRILIPREFKKVSDNAKFLSDMDTLYGANKILFDAMITMNKNHNHWFVRYQYNEVDFITLKTDGPLLRLTDENTSNFLEQYEDLLNTKLTANDPKYHFTLIEDRLNSSHMVKYYKFKYFHRYKNNDWFNTNYMIYANTRTIGLGIFSTNREHHDFQDYMQFIEIK